MKKYKVIIEPKAQKQLKKIDYIQARSINKWIEKNLMGCSNPYFSGKPLKGNLKEYWRYRVGCYRLLANIDDNKIIINIVQIGHRQGIYKD